MIVSGGTGDVTVTVVNAQLSDDTMAFQCHGGGLSTDLGIITMHCKLCHWMKKKESLRFVFRL